MQLTAIAACTVLLATLSVVSVKLKILDTIIPLLFSYRVLWRVHITALPKSVHQVRSSTNSHASVKNAPSRNVHLIRYSILKHVNAFASKLNVQTGKYLTNIHVSVAACMSLDVFPLSISIPALADANVQKNHFHALITKCMIHTNVVVDVPSYSAIAAGLSAMIAASVGVDAQKH